MTHLWEPVRAGYRPAWFYAGVEVLMGFKHVLMLATGFKAHMIGGERGACTTRLVRLDSSD